MNKGSSKINKIGKGIGDFFSTLPNFKALVIIFIILLSISCVIPINVLMSHDYKTGQYIKSWKIKDGDQFTVEYTHSVQLTKVTETYLIDHEDIILLESYFHSLGAGLPATTPYDFELTKEGFRIFNIDEKMDYLVYRTGAQRANHRLYINNKIYDFLDFSQPRTGLKLTTGKLNLLSYFIKEGLN